MGERGDDLSTRGVFACPLPDERERSLGFQAAPAFDALVMFGKRRRPQSLLLGVGFRYAPALLLDTGDELHFALIPEVRGEIGRELELTLRFFNTMGKTFPGRGVGDAQAPVLAACGAISGVAGASCTTISNTLLLTIAIDLGLLQRFDGYALRYQVGFATYLHHNDATASAWTGPRSDASDDDLYAKFATKSWRFSSSIGVEW